MLIGDLEVGQPLPLFVRKTGLDNWNRFAAVNSEFVPIHMDDEAGRAAGYSSAFGMGNLQWAYLHNAVRDWLAGAGRVLKISCQFRGANTKGMTLTVRGVVKEVRIEQDQDLVDVDLWIEDQDGGKLTTGSAVCEVFAQTN